MDGSRTDRSSTDRSRTDRSRTDRSRTGRSRTDRWMDRSEASALADLQMHWDEAYAIGLDGDVWCARFRGSADELRAHTSSELRELIRADYAYRSRAVSARARREAILERETGDASDSPGGYSADAMAGYGIAYEEATTGPVLPDEPAEEARSADDAEPRPEHTEPERTEFAEIRGERMST